MPSEPDAMLAKERLKGGAIEMKTAYLRGAWSLMGRMRAKFWKSGSVVKIEQWRARAMAQMRMSTRDTTTRLLCRAPGPGARARQASRTIRDAALSRPFAHFTKAFSASRMTERERGAAS